MIIGKDDVPTGEVVMRSRTAMHLKNVTGDDGYETEKKKAKAHITVAGYEKPAEEGQAIDSATESQQAARVPRLILSVKEDGKKLKIN